MLYNDYYLPWCKGNRKISVSANKYHRIFCSHYNIGLQLPKSDTCRVCDELIIKINKADIKGRENERN
jgi:hypothetical protein